MSKPWGEEKPTLEEFVEHYESTMNKDEIVERVNEVMGLDLNDRSTKGELLTAVFELEDYDGPAFDPDEEVPSDEEPKESEDEDGMTPGQREDLRLEAIEDIKAEMEDIEGRLNEAREFVRVGEAKLLEGVEKLRQLGGLPVPKMEPALRLLSKRPKSFWCIGKELESGKPLDMALSKLSAADLREIKIKKDANHISVEEVEINEV